MTNDFKFYLFESTTLCQCFPVILVGRVADMAGGEERRRAQDRGGGGDRGQSKRRRAQDRGGQESEAKLVELVSSAPGRSGS